MIHFDTNTISNLKEDEYNEPIDDEIRERGDPIPRWYFEVENGLYIWEWQNQRKSKENSEVATILKTLKNIQNQPYNGKENIFIVPSRSNTQVIPVIYQPALDSMKNFLRAVHCFRKEGDDTVEVNLLFNNEHLTRHHGLDRVYRGIREIRYNRVTDLETILISLEDEFAKEFEFPNIFSGDNNIGEDRVHLDAPIDGENIPRQIMYYFSNKRHPVLFVNTANHAMSFDDKNPRHWKWEYVAWEDDSPLVLGFNNRNQIESEGRRIWYPVQERLDEEYL